MLKIGKKTKKWNAVRRNELIPAFQEVGIIACEVIHPVSGERLPDCSGSWAAFFAHVDKRDNLTPEEIYMCILACNNCHHKIEYFCMKWTGMTMREYVTWRINQRRVQPSTHKHYAELC